jgi:predicted house-cleaning noncanonical NTP pyrophosphatase (MazG superfamily)
VAQIQKTTYGKLVRDRSPEIISGNGEVPRARVPPTERLFPALIAKLHEEADELASAAPADVLGELADFHSGSHGA